MSLFDGFRKKRIENPEKMQNNPGKENLAISKENPVNTESEGFYFENLVELAIYGKLCAKGKTVNWLSGDNYLVEFRKGYQLFEQGQYSRAIEAYRKALVLNPIGLSARFEICEAYLKIGNLTAARDTLFEMKDFLIEEKSIARFYRRLGFIEIEKGNYKIAAACYQYSQKYENHPSVAQELKYIRSKGGFNAVSGNPEITLSGANLPLLSTRSLAD